MTDLREPATLSTGAIIDGRYALREQIGEGGMARVFRAEDLHLKRVVAVKIFRESADDRASIERAQSETLLLASVNHHALVTVFDAHVSAHDTSYLVMEHVEGPTLRDLLRRGPIDAATAASIARDLADGLHTVHTAGIVHRDIKPSNVLLTRSDLTDRAWRAKLADFGIAHLHDTARLTTPGLLMGTAAYIAPEQARGAPPAPAADVYSFGIMMIEALTGERPFADSEGIGTVMARLAGPPEIPSHLPAAWQGLLRGMTAMRPDDRPSAREVGEALSALAASPPVARARVEDEPTAPFPASEELAPTAVLPPVDPPPARIADAPSPRIPDDAPRPRRRRVAIAASAGAAVVAALVGALWFSTLPSATPRPEPTSPVLQEQPSPTDAPPPTAPADEGDPKGDNDNSGPGNNNGNGNGNGSSNGNGNGGGNGNGNGNGGG
ncbi:serine/threonine-protein kinase [Microbacterium sp. NPDC058389]|uniref:serine/threonine-protein kinase n=1 Tax=Microbacterium sp. NPDC058389 TaxID=3346475 RepID=UPI00365DFC2E